MATITRRNRGFWPNPNGDVLGAEADDSAGLARRWWGWGQSRRRSALTALGDASPLSVRNPVINGVVGTGPAGAAAAGSRRFVGQRAAQILWIAVLVYTFLGLPIFGRVLNFLRFAHRVSLASVLKGLAAGLCQDLAILLQASTLICLVKLLFHESSLLSVGAAASGAAGGALGERGAGSWLRSDSGALSAPLGGSFGHSSRSLRIPVYMPVLTSEYEPSGSDDAAAAPSSNSSSAAAADIFGKHTTLLAGVAGPTTSYLSSLVPRGTWFFSKVRRAVATSVTVVLIQAVVVVATIASVVDFCLQVTMHPRLNRAFVEVFINYAAQFAASLQDEEVVTRTVVCSWAVYLALVGALTFGFYANKFPLLPRVFFAPGGFGACFACDRHLHQGKRKDSMLSSTAASSANAAVAAEAPRGFFAVALLPLSWFAAKPLPPPQQRPRRRSGQNHSLFPSQQPSSLFGCGSSASSAFSTKPSPSTVVLRGVVASVAVTVFALSTSLIVDGHGVDMKLMSNAMFSLQTEGFFIKTHSINREEINCTLASEELLATLGKSEVYEIAGLGNDDRCALLWRKTIGFTGDTFFDFTLKNVTVTPATMEESIPVPATVVDDGVGSTPAATLSERANATDATEPTTTTTATTEATTTATTEKTATETTAATTATTEAKTKVSMPNIIVINMESWRALDVGVLGGAERKAKFGKSATPEFDALAKTGILYRKHFTQCVQTTRTLLTMLFGMLPSCTETTALKRYATSLNVRGLPQFLKARGYFNMFWSAVNLRWENWDKFLLQNSFDKLVDDRKIRKMLHEVRNYKNREDDHFSWGMHDHLSFEMLLHAIESAHNATRDALARKANSTRAVATAATVATGATPLRLSENAPGATTPVQAVARNDSTTSTKKPAPKSLLRGGVKGSAPQKTKSTASKKAKRQEQKEEETSVLAGWEGLQEPYFIDMYSISSHNPWALPLDYTVPPELASLYTAYTKKYIDSMYFSDEMLGKFVRELRAKGLLRNTVVVIQGDHGYGRMEHNNPSIADSGIYDEGAHVPFLLLADDFLADADKGREVSQLTMQSDLMATLADILGVSPDAPLYQHGYGHSMRRRRPAASASELNAVVERLNKKSDGVRDTPATAMATAAATVTPATAAALTERRVLLCNPFNGMMKGVRTEERKYAFFPDGAFKVFEQARDPGEKSPVRAGFDVATMDVEVQTMFAFANEHVELNQFLFEANKFSTPLPPPLASRRRRSPLQQQLPHVQRLPIPVAEEEEGDAQRAHGSSAHAAAAIATPHSAPAAPADSR
ncbi:hypothetical protein PybrP1_007072 [[Pythium] brassicae (nom. inval.)]|nr:hypothetical protein PybrP1_007072 [[Pythium] brassicae (nom. inval.)]